MAASVLPALPEHQSHGSRRQLHLLVGHVSPSTAQGGTDLGDLGYCFGLCDCPSECPAGLVCVSVASPSIGLSPVRGRQGLCLVEATGDVVLSCE